MLALILSGVFIAIVAVALLGRKEFSKINNSTGGVGGEIKNKHKDDGKLKNNLNQ